jgi:7-cyano-7-deazaguanine synthase in queuosine biosynthesis
VSKRDKEVKQYGLNLVVTDSASKRQKIQDDRQLVEIGGQIRFDAAALDTYNYQGWKPLHHDLLVLCAAIEFADRRCARRLSQWSRLLSITVPVQQLGTWQKPKVQETLRDALRQLTGDEWNITFVQGNGAPANSSRQRALPFGNGKEFAIAYSDGIDSRCVSGLYDRNDNAIRVRVTKSRDRLKKGERPFDLIPFHVKPKPSPENSVRSRGFKFAAITAIAGHLSGVAKIIVPESGQGALGPVLLPLHNIYPDYRNHPVFFRKMEAFVAALLGFSIAYEQPRLWSTKGQTISDYLAQPGKTLESVVTTRSCWQQRWNARLGGKLRQCGLCAACLLRRMSMQAAKVNEPEDAYIVTDLAAETFEAALPKTNQLRLSKTMIDYGSVGARHLKQLADLADLPDKQLQRNAFEIADATGRSEEETLEKLRHLLVQHAEEWRNFLSAQGKKSFINRWIEGGRNG